LSHFDLGNTSLDQLDVYFADPLVKATSQKSTVSHLKNGMNIYLMTTIDIPTLNQIVLYNGTITQNQVIQIDVESNFKVNLNEDTIKKNQNK
jgi:hypothetical protein